MNDNSYTIFCSRCGAEMKSSARYCMKCGNLNPDHPENKSMEKFMPKSQGYFVGSGKSIVGTLDPNSGLILSVANNTGSSKMCFLLTFGIYFIIVFLIGLSTVLGLSNIHDIIYTKLAVTFLIISGIFIFIYSSERMYMKMNKPWWAALVPFYNYFVLSDVIFNNMFLGFLIFVPMVGNIYMLILYYKLGKAFNKNGVLTALFPLIMIPIIGFGDSLYNNRSYIKNDSKNSLEKDYKFKKISFSFAFFLIIISIINICYVNLGDLIKLVSSSGDWYYYYAGNKMYKEVKKQMEDGTYEITCDNVVYKREDGTIYFYYLDVGDEYNLMFSVTREPIEGYVKVVSLYGERKYYVSVTDGKRGIKEIDADQLKVSSASNFKKLDETYINSKKCELE